MPLPESLVRALKKELKKAEYERDEMARRAATDLYDALEWAPTAIASAAILRVFGRVLELGENGMPIDALLTMADNSIDTLSRSGCPANSPTQMSMALQMERLAAWVEVREYLHAQKEGHLAQKAGSL